MNASRSKTRWGKGRFAGNRIARVAAAVTLLAASGSWAQFGPYTPDANTVTLFHFDGTAVNDNPGMRDDSSANGYDLGANGMKPLLFSANLTLTNSWNENTNDFGTAANNYVGTTYVGGGTNWTVETLLNIQDFDGAAPGERRSFLAFDSGAGMGLRPDGFFEFVIDGASRFSTASQVETGVWFHIAMTYEASSGTVKIYKNGTDITGGGAAAPLNEPLSGVFRLGRASGNVHVWMDEVRVSDTIRTFTPFDPNIAPIPEPSTIALLVLAAAVVSRRIRQRRS